MPFTWKQGLTVVKRDVNVPLLTLITSSFDARENFQYFVYSWVRAVELQSNCSRYFSIILSRQKFPYFSISCYFRMVTKYLYGNSQSFQTKWNRKKFAQIMCITNQLLTKTKQTVFKKYKTCTMSLASFSTNLLAFHHKCRSLIGYASHYLFCDR